MINPTKPAFQASLIESLEYRIAPAALVDYLDVDGDKVTISDSSGTLTDAHLTVVNGQLQVLDLTDAGFQDANIVFRVSKVSGGDGLADVGYINATGRDLGKVMIRGDLGQIDAGDGETATAAINSLTTMSFGRMGLATQGPAVDLESMITGDLDKLSIKGDMTGVLLHVVSGDIGTLEIGGSFLGTTETNGGRIDVSGLIGAVKIGRDLVGGSGAFSGHINGGALGNVTIGGDVVGGTGGFTGMLYGNDSIGAVKIGGSLIGDGTTTGGGLGDNGLIQAGFGNLKSVTIRGSLIGGRGDFSGSIVMATGMGASGVLGFVKIGGDIVGGSGGTSGSIFAVGVLGQVAVGRGITGGSGGFAGSIICSGSIGPVKMGANLQGGGGGYSGVIYTYGGSLEDVTIGGSVRGGSGAVSGGVFSLMGMGVVSITGSLIGGDIVGTTPTLDSTGFIESGGRIEGLKIGGSVISGTDDSTAGSLTKSGTVRSGAEIGFLRVQGSLIGNKSANGDSPVIISARGESVSTDDHNVAIGKITIGGSVERVLVLAGYSTFVSPGNTSVGAGNGDAEIGAVSVGGDWIASSLVAGVVDVENDGFGDADDAVIGVAGSTARIASIVIKGTLFGSEDTGRFGFVSHEIGSFKVGGFKAPLTSTFDIIERSVVTGDVTIREV